jgi:class 3 adenylate cyclase
LFVCLRDCRHIADALKEGRKVEPENHELVTIVFSDIKGFTDISRQISPMKVSEMLDRLYLAFDRIAGKHKVRGGRMSSATRSTYGFL